MRDNPRRTPSGPPWGRLGGVRDPRQPPDVCKPVIDEGVQPTLLQAIVGSAMDAIVALDSEQRIVLFNPAAEAMFGCPAAEALGRPLDRFLPPRFRAVHHRHVETFGATGDTSRSMGHLRPLMGVRADGEEFPIEATIAQVEIGGEPYYAAIVRDITWRQTAETEHALILKREAAALAGAEAAAARGDHLQVILDDLPGGVLLFADPDARIEFANAAMLDLVFGPGSSRQRLPDYGRDFHFLRSDGTPLGFEERPAVRGLRGERVQNLQLVMEREAAESLPIAVQAVPLRDGAAIARAIVFVQDVTQVRQAEQLKDDFLALVSHELRTPLTAIHGGAHLLASEADLDAATHAELLADVVAESDRLDRLLSNLLSLTNVLAGRVQPATEPVLIAPLARRMAAEVGARSPGHTFVIDVSPTIPAVEADPDLLAEVLRNLYENAVKYAPQGGTVLTSAVRQAGAVAIHITDDGGGIAPEHVRTVFERFRRVGGDPTVRGMGLGLYLSRSLVEAQGGQIEASSPGLGHGSTFTVTLPFAREWSDAANA